MYLTSACIQGDNTYIHVFVGTCMCLFMCLYMCIDLRTVTHIHGESRGKGVWGMSMCECVFLVVSFSVLVGDVYAGVPCCVMRCGDEVVLCP